MVGKGIGMGGKRYRYWWEKVSVWVGKGIDNGGKRYRYTFYKPYIAIVRTCLKILKIKILKIKRYFLFIKLKIIFYKAIDNRNS